MKNFKVRDRVSVVAANLSLMHGIESTVMAITEGDGEEEGQLLCRADNGDMTILFMDEVELCASPQI